MKRLTTLSVALLAAALAACNSAAPLAPSPAAEPAPATVESGSGIAIEAEVGLEAGTRVTTLANVDPGVLSGAQLVADAVASGGQAVWLPRTDDTVRFTMPSSLVAGTYTVRVRARGQEYEGWPVAALRVGGSQVATNEVETADYVNHTFGNYALAPGQTLEVAFTNDGYGGAPDKDRNLYVDHLVVDLVSASGGTSGGGSLSGDWYVDDGAASGGNGSSARPFKKISDAVARASSGQTVVVRAGTYREQVVVDKTLKFLGEPGATIKGSDVWTGFNKEGSVWSRAFGVNLPGANGSCKPGTNGRCASAAQVYIDGAPQYQEMDLGAVGEGEFYIGYGKVYLGTNPSGRTVEVSTRQYWLADNQYWGIDNVVVKGFKMTHLANAGQKGAIFTGGVNSSGWLIEGNDLSYAHGAGIRMEGSNHVILNNKVRWMGQMGVAGGGVTNVRVEGNEIAYNNTEEFNWNWEGGGLKMGGVTNVTITNNEVHHNDGGALWCDVDCDNVRYTNNRVHHNLSGGIQYEISKNCLIEGNLVWEEGHQASAWVWGAGIKVQNSSGCVVKNNVVAWNADGISVVEQDRGASRTPTNNSVHDNVIVTKGATAQLAFSSDMSSPRITWSSSNNRGWNNKYYWDSSTRPYWSWAGSDPIKTSLAEWNATPGEENGRQMSWSETAAILSSKGMPTSPER